MLLFVKKSLTVNSKYNAYRNNLRNIIRRAKVPACAILLAVGSCYAAVCYC